MNIADGYHALAPGKVASVVTYVQMTARPEWIDGEFAGGLTAMDLTDLGPYRAMFRRVGENWLWFSRLRATDEQLRERVGRPGYQVLLFLDGRGFVELDRTAEDEVEISLFGLAPGETGHGLGRAMMAHALRIAWAGGTRRVWLHTCTLDDPRALGFYRKMGFRAYARGIEIADDPRLKGYLPETAAPQVPIIG
ncbi:MAG: GNAT family N-acetyltransferase [Bryobacterales bacterium]|nr:GNAT family N-acetyltransferase [Bryobacterales bacterium]